MLCNDSDNSYAHVRGPISLGIILDLNSTTRENCTDSAIVNIERNTYI